MSDDSAAVRAIDYRRLFPWLHLSRAFRMAIDVRKLFLAGLALLAVTALDAGYNRLRFGGETAEVAESGGDGLADRLRRYRDDIVEAAEGGPPRGVPDREPRDGRRELLPVRWPWETPGGVAGTDPGRGAAAWVGSALAPLRTPVDTVLVPVWRLADDENLTGMDVAYLVVRLLWTLAVWALVAGAITRIVALEFARDERIGAGAAIAFSARRFPSFFGAPLLAFVAVLVLAALCAAGGLVGRIPYFGPVFAGILWFLPLLAGLVMSLVVIGAVVGWPLMYATVSVQDSDAFDGFSRSYTFVFGHPWYTAWLAVLSAVLGGIGVALVALFIGLTLSLSQWAVGLGMGEENVAILLGASDAGTIGTPFARFWTGFLALLVSGFGASFFWTATTIAYLLLRRADDGTALTEVEVDEEARDELAPLAGLGEEHALAASPTSEEHGAEEDPNTASSENAERPQP